MWVPAGQAIGKYIIWDQFWKEKILPSTGTASLGIHSDLWVSVGFNLHLKAWLNLSWKNEGEDSGFLAAQ